MSALGALIRSNPLESPTMSLSDAALSEWLAGERTSSGVTVTERKVYGLSAYYRGVALLAGTMAGLPLHAYVEGTRERVPTGRTVLANPNPRQTRFEFWQTMYANAITWGNGFAELVRNRAGVVVELWPIHPSQVRVVEVPRSEMNPAGKGFQVHTDQGQRTLTPYEIFHLPYLSIDGISGLRPLELFRQAHGISLSAEQMSGSLFANGGALSGVLQTEQSLEDEDAGRLQARWRAKHAGPKNAGNVAVLDKGLKFQPLSLPPGDAQLLQSREFSVEEVARMLGLPPHLVGAMEKSSSWGAGIEQQNIGLVVFNVQHWLTMVEQRIAADVFPGGRSAGIWYAKYAVEGLLRGDSASRASFYDTLIKAGVIAPNEARALEELEPIEGGDERLLPAGVLPADQASFNAKLAQLNALVRQGFIPEAACEALGLPVIAHSGLIPVTVLAPDASGGATLTGA